MEEPTLLDQKLPEWTSFDDGPEPLLIPADLKPPWMWDPKLTAGQPDSKRKQQRRVRLSWRCACQPSRRAAASGRFVFTNVRDLVKHMLKHDIDETETDDRQYRDRG